ncbi:Uncharacterised protein [Yersinia frederiksenii]|uniref:Uncharacterized protein n=2 Tax=Yersinia frederiksenii TaxID=29484 RepID=A0A380PQW7_YERFR|nr:hypothetical protein DJ58_2619 [Yersinia frederiksenii ATCC 33641]SUP75958.1 Uncharacterised protein [Yersinia frederiksenii]
MINNMFKKCLTTLGLKNKQAQESESLRLFSRNSFYSIEII